MSLQNANGRQWMERFLFTLAQQRNYSDRTVISLPNEPHFLHVQEVAQHLSCVSSHRRPLDPIAGLPLPRELEVNILAIGKRYDREARRQLVF
mgnify:CR=1 FL=1